MDIDGIRQKLLGVRFKSNFKDLEEDEGTKDSDYIYEEDEARGRHELSSVFNYFWTEDLNTANCQNLRIGLNYLDVLSHGPRGATSIVPNVIMLWPGAAESFIGINFNSIGPLWEGISIC